MGQLMLTRKVGESIVIGTGEDRIVITLVEIRFRQHARLGFECKRHIPIVRSELLERGQEGESCSST